MEKLKWISTIETKKIKYYKGIRIKADWGLHEQIADICVKYLVKDTKILDFGCGEGALSQRLYDIGQTRKKSQRGVGSYLCGCKCKRL